MLCMASAASATPIDDSLPPEEDVTPSIALDETPQSPAAAYSPKIPDHPVTAFIKRGNHSRFEIFFLDLKNDYDLVDFEYYKAWCLAKNKKLKKNVLHNVRLYNSDSPDLPAEFRHVNWNQVNYILNHKRGPSLAVQEAVWHLIDDDVPLTIPEAQELVDEAAEKGNEYVPGEGEVMGIICCPEEQQPLFLEFTVPPKSEPFAVAGAVYTPPVAAVPGLSPWWALLGAAVIPAPFISGSDSDNPIEPTPPVVPEPSGLPLLGLGALVVLMWWKRVRCHRCKTFLRTC